MGWSFRLERKKTDSAGIPKIFVTRVLRVLAGGVRSGRAEAGKLARSSVLNLMTDLVLEDEWTDSIKIFIFN